MDIMLRLKQRRHSCPMGDGLPMYTGQPLDTVNENSEHTKLFPIKKLLKGRRGKRASFSGASGKHDLSEFALPGLEEADEIDGGDFRPRASSAGIKSLIKFRNRNKSGDVKNVAPHATPPEDRKGLKGFFDSIRPRSKSDAATLRQANSMRKKHLSGGQSGGSAARQVLNQDQQNMLGSGDMDPMQRPRSTSLGAKDRLRMMKVSGAAPSDKTMMGKLISNGLSNQNGQLSRSSSEKTNNSSSMSSMEQTEHHYTGQALIWSESDPAPGGDLSADLDKLQIEDIEENDPLVFNKFMRAHKCYDIIPNSSKLIVFDTSLSVKKAFYALVYNGVRAAPLWDNKSQQFIGMLTITDFIMILHKYYKSPEDPAGHEQFKEKMHELAEHMISTWRQELSHHYRPFICISPEDSVCAAVRKLSQAKVHRLPVIDPVSGNAVYVITHKRILKFMNIFMKNLPKPTYVNESIESLQLGTYDKIVSVRMDSKVIEALGLFVKTRVSALPVVTEDNKVLEIYAKFDVLNLAAEKTYNDLDVTIEHVLRHRQAKTEHVVTCHRTDTLSTVIDKIVKAGVHRLVIVNSDNVLEGVISLSDILTFLLQEDVTLYDSMSNTRCVTAMSTESVHTETTYSPIEAAV